ncbi:LuxR C-terminal-related transcriptional regulator [Flindersiella endophytica]
MSDVEISAREAEVLAAIAEHRSNAQIARAMHISVRTVESHVSSLLRKYGVTDRRELAGVAGGGRAPGMLGLPASRTTFVGRSAETAAVAGALRQARLVTLLGPGGMGKTRLATVVAAELGIPGAFVDLVPVRDGLVARAVATALGVTERPPQTLEQALAERLRTGRTLLVLDNCEHLIEDVAEVVERLLATGAETSVLATSRERLGVPGEHTVVLPPLPTDSEAVQLFTDRARAVDPAFGLEPHTDPAALAELCAQLDGMPLAIELAAARTASLGIDGLRSTLDDRLRLLAGGRGTNPRHRSLAAMIGWSHDLLDDDERLLFRRLAVYVGGFDLDAACATSVERPRGDVADLLGRLTDKSLLVRRGTRWRLLDTIRAFALEQLGPDELVTARERHLGWAADAAAALENEIDEATWPAAYDEVVGDLRAALAHTPAAAAPVAHRLARSLGHLAFARREFTEAVAHYTSAADRAEDGAMAARDLRAAADAALAVADGQAAVRLLLEAADRAVADGNVRATMLASAVIAYNRHPAGPLLQTPEAETARLLAEAEDSAVTASGDAHVEALLATARAWERGHGRAVADAELARRAVEVARRSGDPVLIAGALDARQVAAAEAGRLREARGYALERIRLTEPLPRHEPYAAAEIVDAHHNTSTTAVAIGDLRSALADAQAAMAGDPTADHPYILLPRLIRLYALMGRFDECLSEADALWERWQRDGSPPMEWMASALSAAAMVHGLREDGSFGEWQQRALEVARVSDPAASPSLAAPSAFAAARVAVHTGDLAGASDLVTQAFAGVARGWWAPYAQASAAELAVVAGLPDSGARLAAAAPLAAENDWAAACLSRVDARLTGDAQALSTAVDGFARIGARFERACTLLLSSDPAAGAADLNALGVPRR